MIKVYTLGGASIELDPPACDGNGAAKRTSRSDRDHSRITPAAPRRFALLLYLAIEQGRRVSRERLQTLVFPDQSAASARHSLREALYQLRGVGAPINAENDDLFVDPRDVWCDFADALSRPDLDADTIRAIAGAFLPGYSPSHSEALTEWYETLRASTISALVRKLLSTSVAATRAARWDTAERAVRACLAIDPWNEEATLALAELLASAGSKAAALRLLDDYAAEIGSRSVELKLPVALLRRRIGEDLSGGYAVNREGRDPTRAFILPPFVGRDDQMVALHEALARAREGEAQCVVVTGDPGIGKTRLVDEFSRAAALKGARVERVVMQPHDGERPMGAFVDAVPGLVRAPGALGCAPASMTALRNLTRQAGDDATTGGVVDAEQHERRWSAISRAITDLCEAIASEAPLVLVVDDAQWLDALSANTIGRVVARRRKAAILVILTSRDPRGVLHELRLTERCLTIALGPLDTQSTEQLLQALIPDDGASSGGRDGRPDSGDKDIAKSVALLKARIGNVSAGNPLFLISLATTSRGSNGSLSIPHTIIESFTQRIDALSRRGQSVLATCVALGKHSSVARIVAALELKSHELLESLLELTDSGLVLQSQQSAVPAHPLVSEALSLRLPESVKQAVAGAVAAALQRDAESGASPGLWWDVAEGWRAAANHERAIAALRQCADHALEIGRPGEAARILEHAAAIPQSTESDREVNRAIVIAADAANEFSIVLRAAERFARSVPLEGDATVELAMCRAAVSFHHSEVIVEERLRQRVRSRDVAPKHRVDAACLLLKCADMFDRADLREEALRALDEADLGAVDTLTRLDFQLLASSAAGDRMGAAKTASEILTLDPDDDSSLKPQRNAATALVLADRFEAAVAALQQVFALSERRGSQRGQLFAAVQLSAIFLDLEKDDDADAWLLKALEIQRESVDLAVDFELIALRLELALGRNDFDQAAQIVEQGKLDAVFNNGNRLRWKRAAEAAIHAARGGIDPVLLAEVRAILRDQLRTMTGVREFEVAVCAAILATAGRCEEAASAVREYFDRERIVARAPSRLLSRAARLTGLDAASLPRLSNRRRGRRHGFPDSHALPTTAPQAD